MSDKNEATNNFYSWERSDNTGKTCSSGTYCNDTVERTTVFTGKVALIYPSDYSDCKDNNWLRLSGNTLTPAVSICWKSEQKKAYLVFYVSNDTVTTGWGLI